MEKALEGQVALVTGASRGIGRAIAETFAAAGASVVLTSRSAEAAEKAAGEIAAATGGTTRGAACDNADSAACEALIAGIKEREGRLDILVNNAGITRDNLLLRMSGEEWTSVFDTNLHGAFYLTRPAAKIMLKQKSGRIINIASIVGLTGNPGQSNYAATKAGLIAFTKSVARELGSRGITANAIAPGYIETDMSDAISDKMKEQLKGSIPLGRLGLPDDIAQAALWLASPAASYVTGTVIQVDGGLAM